MRRVCTRQKKILKKKQLLRGAAVWSRCNAGVLILFSPDRYVCRGRSPDLLPVSPYLLRVRIKELAAEGDWPPVLVCALHMYNMPV